MRIIGGSFKGRKFYPPADKWPTRPTTDYSKEGLFNILTNRYDFEEWKVLDLFGGTGNHSYEFISSHEFVLSKSDYIVHFSLVQFLIRECILEFCHLKATCPLVSVVFGLVYNCKESKCIVLVLIQIFMHIITRLKVVP